MLVIAHLIGESGGELHFIRGHQELLGPFDLQQAIGMITVQMGQQHRIQVRIPDTHGKQLLINALARADPALIDLIQHHGAQRPDLGFPVKLPIGAHFTRPARIHQELSLRMLNQIRGNRKPEPVFLFAKHAGCLDGIAVVAAKRQVGCNANLAGVEYMNSDVSHEKCPPVRLIWSLMPPIPRCIQSRPLWGRFIRVRKFCGLFSV